MITPALAGENEDVRLMIEGLCSRQAGIREKAEASLARLTSSQIDELLAILRIESTRIMKRMGFWFAVAAIPMVFGPAWLTFGEGGGLPVPARLILFIAFIGGYMTLFAKLVAKPRLQNALTHCAINVRDARMIGPLISRTNVSLGDTQQSVNKIAMRIYRQDAPVLVDSKTLISALDAIEPDEEIDLTNAERFQLRMLLHSSNSALVLGLMKVLVKVGGNTDLPILRSLAKGSHSARNHPDVQQAASEALEKVTARLNTEQMPDTLLRASQPFTPPKTLLRAATPAPNENSAELLRPTQEIDTPVLPVTVETTFSEETQTLRH